MREIPERYPGKSDSKSRSSYTIETDADIVEDDVDREDDSEYPGSCPDLPRPCEELEIDLYE